MNTPPVLFLIFNRKENALLSFERIRLARPSRLFIAADGPRSDREGECSQCHAVRDAILGAVDWECEIKTLFRDENLGCRQAVSQAITWFFNEVEAGIIIEDDCIVSHTFFRFCAELLERYRDDERILSISANCFQPSGSIRSASYYFSKYQHCWGWASWKRAWRKFMPTLEEWPRFRDAGGLAKYNEGCKVFDHHFAKIFNQAHSGEGDSWAFIWLLTGWMNDMLTIHPAVNMSQNTGLGTEATHTLDRENWTATLPALELAFPLIHPGEVCRNRGADRWSDIHLWHIRRLQPLIRILSHSSLLRSCYHKLYMPILRQKRKT